MKILLIEDDLDDIGLFEEALKDHGAPYAMDTLNDGNVALDYIAAGSGHPDIIILDFNLPKVHGRELVSAIKSSHDLSSIPLVVLTTSSAREDMDFAYGRGVDKFFTKPTTMAGLAEIVEAIFILAARTGPAAGKED
jgi:DNA-binding response OmpR family regulator